MPEKYKPNEKINQFQNEIYAIIQKYKDGTTTYGELIGVLEIEKMELYNELKNFTIQKKTKINNN